MRNLICACAVAALAAGSAVGAQDVQTDTKSRTKISVDEGREISVTGCVARSGDGNFSLTHAAGRKGEIGSYVLVAEGKEREQLGEHVGHRVEVTGRAADQGDGRLTIRSENEVRNGAGDRRKRESTTTVKGDLEGLPFLGVKSVRMLASTCP